MLAEYNFNQVWDLSRSLTLYLSVCFSRRGLVCFCVWERCDWISLCAGWHLRDEERAAARSERGRLFSTRRQKMSQRGSGFRTRFDLFIRMCVGALNNHSVQIAGVRSSLRCCMKMRIASTGVKEIRANLQPSASIRPATHTHQNNIYYPSLTQRVHFFPFLLYIYKRNQDWKRLCLNQAQKKQQVLLHHNLNMY